MSAPPVTSEMERPMTVARAVQGTAATGLARPRPHRPPCRMRAPSHRQSSSVREALPVEVLADAGDDRQVHVIERRRFLGAIVAGSASKLAVAALPHDRTQDGAYRYAQDLGRPCLPKRRCANAGCRPEQYSAPHFLSCRELREALRNCLGGYDYADFGMITWHTRGMLDDGCSTVSRSGEPSWVCNG
jgi:hypothetical protein